MVSTTSNSNSNHEENKQTLNSKNPKNVYQIGGLQVEFPYQPYGTQLAFMSRVISTLYRAQRDRHSHALLESPTDTPSLTNDEIPTIFYASRAHAQITQVIREYRKTGYRVPMAGSRKRYCINRYVKGKDNVDERCRPKCLEYKCTNFIIAHPSIRKDGDNGGVHDIEDLVKVGETVRGRLLNTFTFYSNMEDIAREAGSIDLEEETLLKLQMELEEMSEEDAVTYQPLCTVVDGLIKWIGRRKDSLSKRDSEHYFSGWTGDKALREFEESNITEESLKCFEQAILHLEAAEIDPDMPYLSGISFKIVRELLATFTYFFSRNGSHILDYQLVLQRSIKKGDSSGKWTLTFSLWCMNPSVVFKELADLSLSIILTSGTLSPMNSFSSELGMQFGTCLEAPHVIDANLQVWAGAISNGPGNFPLNASYKTADVETFQDAIGKSLEEICTIVPGGSLIFFPSYNLMEKLCTRWRETGQWSRLCLKKEIFIVELKRKYNDAYITSKNLLGGSEWYCQQAYRALNQAAGRCIRHRFDYGAIIFLDERYRQQRNRVSISKWLRQSINLYDNFEESMQGLKAFFNTVKERVDIKKLESRENQSKECKRSENQMQNKSSHVEPKEDMAGRKVDYRSSIPRYNFTNESNDHNKDRKPNVHAQTFIQVKEEAKCCKQVIDIDCEGCCDVSSVTNCDERSSSERSLRSSDQFLKRHISSPNLRRSPLGAESSAILTPERYSIVNSSLEAESTLNKSVNSHALKRRKFTGSPVIIDLEEENSDAPSTKPPDHTRKIEFGFGSSEPRSKNYYKVSCSLCKNPLGHHSYLNCMLTSSSKKHLLSLLKETSSGAGYAEMSTSVSVVMTDCSLVHQRLCGSLEGSKGVWCEEDGCVFNTIFCPFCSIPNTCLGVKIMATDSSNVQFQSKILFFADQVDVTEDDAASSKIKEEEAGEVQNQSCNLPTSKKA
ncbi:unnamed protein product [Arabis nemorensis]|uniref:ATP-dependent helicase C-terminal domain-containing protein n=1 Tax=Arabis nemorensis TaxID=586526 RepID=A0A565ARF1_9BRAS|nr:unnamed protein product [Arabis nemorensis]